MDNKHYTMDQAQAKELSWTLSTIPKFPGHLLQAVVGPSVAFTEQPPPDPAKDPGSNEMLLGGASLHFQPLAWQHVVRPSGGDACPLDHPLEHRQQQGDEPQKHQLCIAPSQKANVSAVNIFILSGTPEKMKGRPGFLQQGHWLGRLTFAELEKVPPFSRQIKQVFFSRCIFAIEEPPITIKPN